LLAGGLLGLGLVGGCVIFYYFLSVSYFLGALVFIVFIFIFRFIGGLNLLEQREAFCFHFRDPLGKVEELEF